MYKNKKRRKDCLSEGETVTKSIYSDFHIPRIILFSLCLIVLGVFTNPVSANDKSVFNIDMYYGWNGYYRPMEWTPVEITINNSLKNVFGGRLTLSSQQDGLNTLNVMYDLALTPEVPEYVPLVTKMAFSTQGCSLKLDQTEGRRKTVWRYDDNNIIAGLGKNIVNEYDMLIGVVGADKFTLHRLENDTTCQFKTMRGNVKVGSKQAKMVPWDWTGFASLDLLVLYNPDWSLFRDTQLKAISEWISNGGTTLIVLGSRPLMGENPLTEIIPFDYLDAKEVSISEQQLYNWKLSTNEPETVTLRPIVPEPDTKLFEGNLYQNNQYLFACGNVGFGKIALLGFDPSDFSSAQDKYASRFWANMVKTLLNSDSSTENTILSQRKIQFLEESLNQPDGIMGRPARAFQSNNQNYYQIGSAYSLNNKVMEFLYQEIKPLSVWFVILLLGALAVLLGPVDYKFLKHIDRLPLTWLTCTFWIILFTVGAYYGVQYVRGGKMQLRVVTVIDGIEGGDKAWSTDYSGLFASKSDSYQLENLRPNQWWSGIAPTQDQIYVYNSELGSRRIYCKQEDGGNLPESLPVNIWDIQCMLTESAVEKVPFSADVQRDGSDIVVTITNESDAPIMNGYVLVDRNHGIEFSNVPAHGVQEFRSRVRTLPLWENNTREFTQNVHYSNPYQGSFKKESAFYAQGTLQRTQAMTDYLNKGASVVCVTYDNAPISFRIKNRSFDEEHIQMARLVVFPN